MTPEDNEAAEEDEDATDYSPTIRKQQSHEDIEMKDLD